MELSDGHETLNIKIVSVMTQLFGNLTQEHAQWEGFSSVDELRKDLEKYYRHIDENQPVTIIKFDLIKT